MQSTSKSCRRFGAVLLLLTMGALPARAFTDPRDEAAPFSPAADTCARWENPTIAPNRSPFRTNHVAVFDPAHRRMIVCGGDQNLGGDETDVWICSLDGSPEWTRVAGLVPAPPFLNRGGLAAVFDSRRNRMLLFGESPPGPGCEVWALTLVPTPRWSRLDVAGPTPGVRTGASAVYDRTGDRMIIFGGLTYGPDRPAALSDVWSLSLSGSPMWTELHPTGESPSPRWHHTAIYDSRRNRMVVFGGSPQTAEAAADTDWVWVLSLGEAPSWSGMSPAGPHPTARRGHAACYDPDQDEMVLVGGRGLFDYYSPTLMEAWRLSLDRLQWLHIDAPGSPAGRNSCTAVFDPGRDRVIVFGGDKALEFMTNECWSLSLRRRPDWALISPSAWPTTPPPRMGGRGVLEPRSGTIYLALYDGEMWTLSLKGDSRWHQILPAESTLPPRNYWSFLLVDSRRRRLLAFNDQDLWAFPLGPNPSWEKLPLTGNAPPRRTAPSLVLDPIGDRLLMYGGCIPGPFLVCNRTAELWSLSLSGPSQWQRGEIAGMSPPAMAFHSGIFDPKRHRMVVSGGYAGESFEPPLGPQTWALSLDGAPGWTQLSVAGPPDLNLGPFAAYDPAHDRILDFAFGSAAAPLIALSLADNRVTPLVPEGTEPEQRYVRFLAFDDWADRLVVYGPGMLNYEQRQDLMFARFTGCERDGRGREPHGPGDAPRPGRQAHGISLAGPTSVSGHPEISLVVATAEPVIVEAFDLAGRRVWRYWMTPSTTGLATARLQLPSTLASGIYLVRATQGEETATTRIAVLR